MLNGIKFGHITLSDEPDYVYDGGVTDGEFALDIAGSLCGNWLLEGYTENYYEWTDTLAFGYDVYYPDQIRIGIGTSQNGFAIKNDDNPANPAEVNTQSGAVAYYLYNANNTNKGVPTGTREKIMMVQMLTDSRIKIEIFDDAVSETRQFTSNALFYVR